MKVLQINIFGNLSTGRIAVDLYRTIISNGNEGKIAFARNTIANDVSYIKIGTAIDVMIHGMFTRITDKAGFYSTEATKKFIKKIEAYNPDIIHLHNIHGYYINIELLFNYLKSSKKPVVWTLHDCWPFTGHCYHFETIGCEKWRTKCIHCPQKHIYPASYVFDSSTWNQTKKREIFSDVPNMFLVTPSNWLKKYIDQSFLKQYKVKIIHNGIDLNIFKPTKRLFRERHNIGNKFMILGVASTWGKLKGLDDFIRFNSILDDNYVIVIVGVNDKEIKRLSKGMIGIKRTNDIKELADIYSSADVYLNLSYEENFPTTNIEALACGTPVITYCTGGSPESLDDNCGIVVEKGNLNAVKNALKMIIELNRKACVERAKLFDKEIVYKQYINLYKEILKK